MRLLRPVEILATRAARLAWPMVMAFNRRFEKPGIQPDWSPEPLTKSRDQRKLDLGWPRKTDSLCPGCVKEVREAIIAGTLDKSVLVEGNPAEIEATILERDGKLWMEKECPKHGAYSDVMSIDPAFQLRMSQLAAGADFRSPETPLRRHGSSTIRYGRGAVLNVELTNRCNMMCEPCWADANQVGVVHEPEWEQIKKILDESITIRPHRQMSVQFTGGEPTLSPHFFEAMAYARKLGYFSVQAATNGLRFAEEPGFAAKAKAAGLRLAYLQFDGVGNEANAHRKIANLFDVKLRAIEEMHRAGIDVVLVVTVVGGVNDNQIGKILRFAIENADKITVVSFQPVSFTGRDEDIDPETRARKRYTLSHLVHDVKRQTGLTEPMRDWFPLSAMGPFSDLVDHLLGTKVEWGSMKCACHPSCGVGSVLFVNKKTKQFVPLSSFLDMEQLLRDVTAIADAAQGRKLTIAELGVALLRNFRPEAAPEGYGFFELLKQLMSQMGARGKQVGEYESDAHEFEWRVMFLAAMWFQDVFNYDFRRSEMCIIPYGSEEGEIGFCAYNTGVGWRNIVEHKHAAATTAEWYRTHGRHPVHASHKPLALPDYPNPLTSTVPDDPTYVSDLNAGKRVHLRVVA